VNRDWGKCSRQKNGGAGSLVDPAPPASVPSTPSPPYRSRCFNLSVRVRLTSRPQIVPLTVKLSVSGLYDSVTETSHVLVRSPEVMVVEPFLAFE
jgi:hypothetical protein